MIRHKLFLLTIGLSILLGSCSKGRNDDTPLPDREKDRLIFGVEGVETRGVATTAATIREFGVFCFDTGSGLWANVNGSATPNKMFDQQVVRSGDLWTYDPPVYWENYENKLHSFFAYSPMAKGMLTDIINGELNANGNNLKLNSTQSSAGVPKLQFETIENIASQVDLLVAHERLDMKPVDAVMMNFSHALARIGFKAYSNIVGTYIEKIEFLNIPYKGVLDIVSPAVWSVDPARKNFVIDYGSGLPILSTEANPTDISTPDRYMMTIPNDWIGNTTAKIKIYFRQDGKKIETEFLIGGTGEKWLQNRNSTYVLDLDGVPNNELIVEKVIIEDWKMGNISDSDVGVKTEKYWLRFNTNGGDANIPSDMNLESGILYKIPNKVPEKSGSTFGGWSTSADGSGSIYNVGDRVPIKDKDVTLYAKWN